jgi:hypothetical protein
MSYITFILYLFFSVMYVIYWLLVEQIGPMVKLEVEYG